MAKDSIEDLAKKLITNLKDLLGNEKPSSKIFKSLDNLAKFEHHGIFDLIQVFYEPKETPCLIFENSKITKHGQNINNWDTDIWTLFLRAGFLDIDHTVFYRQEDSNQIDISGEPYEPLDILGEHLSSGQWSWLAGFVGLCAEISENSLILVDEPENSLHPIWQQNYVPTLQGITREFLGSQTIIATHSPLIASGINPEHGNVLALKSNLDREKNHTRLTANPVENTFGWAASDVYQEAFGVTSDRAPLFTATADLALSLIRRNEPLGAVEASLIIDDLTTKLESLPLHDPLRNVLKSIITRLKELIRGEQ